VASHQTALGEVINIGSGREISVGDLAHLIVDLIGSKSKVVEDAQRIRPVDSEVERLLCKNEKARRSLGWTPKVTLEEGLRHSIDWFTKHIDRYKPDIYNI
jgi:dTDP-glucose 4,6-dehydratase